ncbi:MAG: hypothetical protein M8364_08190 [Methylobacter sp.]|nr:hypothetical protein [Methylobacter sp.]MCL7420866.1 hypothetical protein [Methylobacter sp.]
MITNDSPEIGEITDQEWGQIAPLLFEKIFEGERQSAADSNQGENDNG